MGGRFKKSSVGKNLSKQKADFGRIPNAENRAQIFWCIFFQFCRAMLCISAVYAVMRCPSVRLSVRLSVTFVDHVKTNKHIFEIFSPSGSQTMLVFPYQAGWRYSHGNPLPNGGVECRCGISRNRDSGIAGYRRLLDVRSAKNIHRRRS